MKKQPGYTILLVLTILSTLAAVSTILPGPPDAPNSLLGYSTHCPWAPWSTLICVALAAVFCRIRATKFKVVNDTN